MADRLTNRVLRYNDSGGFLGVLLEDAENLDEPNGMALSPDGTHLYVASRQNSRIVRYDYNGATATNPEILIDSGITGPASILFSQDGSKFYVSNLGEQFEGATVAQFNPDGTSAGPELSGGSPAGRSGLAFDPEGNLLVSSFFSGEIFKYSQTAGAFELFIGPNQALQGAGNLLVLGDGLYVVSGFAGSLLKFNATTGTQAPVEEFAPVFGLDFPASLARAPDGNGLLVGILTLSPDGLGYIDRYGLDGTLLGRFATNSSEDPANGFREATGLLVVPGVQVQLGDMNGDGHLNNLDIAPFSLALTDRMAYDEAFPGLFSLSRADINADGQFNNLDISPFAGLLTGGAASPVPEPSAIVLGLIGCCAFLAFRGECSARALCYAAVAATSAAPGQ